MSINLNFGTSNSFKSTTSEQLKAWEIHEVTFDGAEYSEIQGKIILFLTKSIPNSIVLFYFVW